MTVIVESDPAIAKTYASAAGTASVGLESMEQLFRHIAVNLEEDSVVIGESVALELATGFAHDIRISRPQLGVILVRRQIDSSVLAEAMRAGIREVVESRDPSMLADAVARAQKVAEAMRSSAPAAATPAEPAGSEGRVITVFSSKGGVGKSTLTTNLASALTHLGKRVVAVDLDAQGGDLAIMLQLFPTRSLADLRELRGAIDQSGVLSLLTEHESGMQVLAAPLSIEARDHVNAEDVGRVLAVLRGQFDYVLIDTSPGFDDLALTAFDHSDLLILIGTLDIPALKNLKMAAGTLDLLNIPRERWRLVLNRADGKVGLSPSEFEKTLGLSIITSLPTSSDVLASVNRGEALVAANPRHPISQAIVRLAQQIDNEAVPSEAPATVAENRRSRFRLRR